MDPISGSLGVLVAVILIFEGIFPFVSPSLWKDMFKRLVKMSNGQIRFIGLSSMLLGVVLLYIFS